MVILLGSVVVVTALVLVPVLALALELVLVPVLALALELVLELVLTAMTVQRHHRLTLRGHWLRLRLRLDRRPLLPFRGCVLRYLGVSYWCSCAYPAMALSLAWLVCG